MDLCPASDFTLMANLLATFYQQEPGLSPLPEDVVQAKTRRLLDAAGKGKVHPLLLMHGDDVVGYVLLAPFYSNEYGGEMALLDEYLILPDWQGKGLGKRFLTSIQKWAKASGLVGLILEVTDANPRVVGLYERSGFSLLDRRLMAWKAEDGHERSDT